MKKFLLCAALAAASLPAMAESKVYYFKADDDASFDQMGQAYAVSRYGNYAVIVDDEMNMCYLWRKSDPEKLELLNAYQPDKDRYQALEIRAITDDGLMTGSIRDGNRWIPFVRQIDGEMIQLPLHENALNLNYPCGISDDGNVIGGYIGMRAVDEDGIGGSHPVLWVKGDDGEYELHMNEKLALPRHQGANVTCMYSDGTAEGTYLGGSVWCGAGSTIPFIYHNNELKIWDTLETVQVPWYYKGEVRGHVWATTINGKRDYYFTENDAIDSGIYGSDYAGNFYGRRVEVYDIKSTDPEDPDYGNAKHRYKYGIYNINTDQWELRDGNDAINAGIDGKIIFTDKAMVYPDGLDSTPVSFNAYTGADARAVMGVSRMSCDGSVIGLVYAGMDSMGVQHAYPVMVVLDHPLVSINDIQADPESESVILTYNGTIEVIGTTNVEVYDLDGHRVSTTATTANLTPGIYIVKTEKSSRKVQVK